ncbi:MAG: hypothetical protein IKU71_06520, partial [Kiritimatiellae bacterium]|nr:hypothetical protein [Kiritimatiellia bacterium]
MDWKLLGNCVAALECAFALACCVWVGIRALRKLPATLLLALALFAVDATLTAQKTNNVPPNLNSPLPQMMQGGGSFQAGLPFPVAHSPFPVSNPVQTTNADIARGWRIESVTTNAAVSYAMPTNATLVGNWHIHGAASSFGNNVVDFGVLRTSGTLVPTNWAFPLGTNDEAFSSFWYFIDGRIRPTPRDAAHEICAVGVPMSAVPGQSRLWRLDGGDGSRVLTWENFFLGGDTNFPINAQIVLFTNGDFLTRSNDVETVCRRVNPDDWDDDGIYNERDANPTVCDGDFFGIANALPTNANPNAYYWLDLSVTGLLGVATIRVTCDGPSDLGDHVIIARTNQVCHVPLLAGATYAVESDLPIDYSAVLSEYAEIVTNAENDLTISLPLELTFERVQMRGGSDIYVAHTSPVDVVPRILNIAGGCCSCVTNEIGFSWNCYPQCLCGGVGHSLSGAAKWEGYSYPFSWWGRCHCYYEDQTAIDEIESRGVNLEILDASGNAIEWKYPVLVGESVIVKATVGGSEMTVSGFVGLFGERIRLKAYYVDFDGTHDIAGAAIPISATTTTSQGQNVFHVLVAAGWLQSNDIIRNEDDGILSKTSIDMSDAATGDSNRQDSDIFDAGIAGRLYGRARGDENGNVSASIPEGSLNLKTFQAGGTGIMIATCGSALSDKCQVQQQADIIFYSGHGGHENAMLVGGIQPSLLNSYWTNVNAVVLSGCAVLDISNYRQQSFGWKTSLRWRTHGGANSPGEAWESLDVGIL